MIKKCDFVYCIRDYDDFFNIGKEYSIDHADECNISVTVKYTNETSHVYFCRFNNKLCEYRVSSKYECELDKCQFRLDYRSKQTDEYIELYGEPITSCLGSAVCFFDYFITKSKLRKIKIEKINK